MGETSREPLLNLKTRALSEQSQAHPKNEAARSAVPEVNGLYLQCSRLQGWRFGNDAMAPPIPLGGPCHTWTILRAATSSASASRGRRSPALLVSVMRNRDVQLGVKRHAFADWA